MRWSTPPASTSTPATPSRSWFRSAFASTWRPTRSTSTAACARSTLRRTCSFSRSAAIATSWGRRPRSSCRSRATASRQGRSGAPQIRGMEIIGDLEPDQRGVYAGSLGYVSFGGNLDMAITLRTIVVAGGDAYVQAGAGVVADSKPEREFEETLEKAGAMFKAIEMAEEL